MKIQLIQKKTEEITLQEIEQVITSTLPVRIEILFIYDYGVSIAEVSADAHLSNGLKNINKMLDSYKVLDSKGNKIKVYATQDIDGNSGHVYAPQGACGHSNPCELPYKQHLKKMTDNNAIIELRKKYRADLVIFIRATTDIQDNAAGLANRPEEVLLENARTAHALVSSTTGWHAWAHEISHMLGAGHSQYNEFPGPKPRRANIKITIGDGQLYCGQEVNALFTMTADKTVCETENRKYYAKLKTECVYKNCIGPLGFSSAFLYGPDNDNISIIKPMAKMILTYDQYYGGTENDDPIAQIVQVSGSGLAKVKHCWNAIGSSDPGGNTLAGFNWEIQKSGATYETGSTSSVSSQFCWTPTTSETGTFTVNLDVINNLGAIGKVSKPITITYDPNYIEAPVLNGTLYDYSIELSWNRPNGPVDHYEVHEKNNSAAWAKADDSNDTTETYFLLNRTGTYKYKVRGCTIGNVCGDFSNIKTFFIQPDDPICRRPPCGEIP